MKKICNIILPKKAHNDNKSPLWLLIPFVLFLGVMTFRSLMHYIAPDGGSNSIASIIIYPTENGADANTVIYSIFGLWGLSQIIFVIIGFIVLFRYRNLMPLYWLLIFVEYVGRIVSGIMKPITEANYVNTPPGAISNIPFMLFAAIMVAMSIVYVIKTEKK